MRPIKLVRPTNKDTEGINLGIYCYICQIPMPAEPDATILEIDWNLITLPLHWTERHTKDTTALPHGVRRTESKVYYCPRCMGSASDAKKLIPELPQKEP